MPTMRGDFLQATKVSFTFLGVRKDGQPETYAMLPAGLGCLSFVARAGNRKKMLNHTEQHSHRRRFDGVRF